MLRRNNLRPQGHSKLRVRDPQQPGLRLVSGNETICALCAYPV